MPEVVDKNTSQQQSQPKPMPISKKEHTYTKQEDYNDIKWLTGC